MKHLAFPCEKSRACDNDINTNHLRRQTLKNNLLLFGVGLAQLAEQSVLRRAYPGMLPVSQASGMSIENPRRLD